MSSKEKDVALLSDPGADTPEAPAEGLPTPVTASTAGRVRPRQAAAVNPTIGILVMRIIVSSSRPAGPSRCGAACTNAVGDSVRESRDLHH
jgi:hypothetical protein